MATLVLTVIGDDRPGLVQALAYAVSSHEGNWEESQLAELAGKFAGIVVVTVPDDNVGRFTDAVGALADLEVSVHKAADEAAEKDERSRLVLELVGNDHPGIVREISAVLARNKVSIEEFRSATAEAPMYGGQLFDARVTAVMPDAVEVDTLRADLERLATELMVDITLDA